MNQEFTDIPLPQNTKLYSNDPSYGGISVNIINSDCTVVENDLPVDDGYDGYDGYADFKNFHFYFSVFNQNVDEINVKLDDKAVSSIYGNNYSYYDLNGFDYDFIHRFINLESPTVCFLPLIKSKDNSVNINISSGYISTTDLSFEDVEVNDYILLTSQSTKTENKTYRVVSKTGNTIGILADSDINGILNQDQDLIFVRALIQNSNGSYYYGVNNTTPYEWVSQTKGLRLETADYGLTVNSELNEYKIAISVLNLSGITPKTGDTIAININGGGKTTGIYRIYRMLNGYAYFYSIYPNYLFMHQFVKIKYDFNSFSESIWIVDPDYVGSTTYIYSTRAFKFKIYNANSILNTPSNWAKQVGGKNDNIIGFTLYTDYKNNNYIKYSDKFYFTSRLPNWIYDGAKVKGLKIKAEYSTNILDVEQEEVEE